MLVLVTTAWVLLVEFEGGQAAVLDGGETVLGQCSVLSSSRTVVGGGPRNGSWATMGRYIRHPLQLWPSSLSEQSSVA